MTTNEIRSVHQKELHAKLWSMANELRGNMEAYEFKNYILGTIFYHYLSEKFEKYIAKLLKDETLTFEKAWEDEETREALIEESLETLGYVIEPQYLFRNILKAIETDCFDIEFYHKSINNLTESTIGQLSQEDFDGLFDDMDLTSNKLGKEIKDRSKLISKILVLVDSIDFGYDETEIDVLGDAYEYLMGQFAANAGKRAGEFFTEQTVSHLVSRIATVGITDVLSASDCTCGSGSLLLNVGKYSRVRKYFGSELTSTTFNLCRMNLLLHGIEYQNFNIKNCDTLENPAFKDELFQVQVANPPYSVQWSADSKFLDDERFSAYGKLAPKSKADFAFVQHMIHHMTEDGNITVLLPHGVLFRGGAEGVIREFIIKEQNYLDAVIGLPANLFWGTSIPVSILHFKKNRENKDNVLFIDASKFFEQGKNQNRLREEDVERIIETFKERKDVEKYAHVASMDELEKNGYNLNIPRYVNTFEAEEVIDIIETKSRINLIKNEVTNLEQELECYFKQLGI